jgi:hypothetical protein
MSSSHSLMGGRGKRNVPIEEVVARADEALSSLETLCQSSKSLSELKTLYAPVCRDYYSLAAASRRSSLTPEDRQASQSRLFRLRSSIERSILDSLDLAIFDVLKECAVRSFFGASQKQGVSIRYPLSACIPTVNCGGGCYAHDGRDRAIHQIFRGVLNLWIGLKYEAGNPEFRKVISDAMQDTFDYAISSAREDALRSAEEFGFIRSPRIRFAHVGEMVTTPMFLSFLADELQSRDPALVCVLYTRHPNAKDIALDRFVVNFSIEGPNDPRRRHAPFGAQIVCSAWGGALMEEAHVNFPEHHVNTRSERVGKGFVCPVVAGFSVDESCDGARCDRCFTRISDIPSGNSLARLDQWSTLVALPLAPESRNA